MKEDEFIKQISNAIPQNWTRIYPADIRIVTTLNKKLSELEVETIHAPNGQTIEIVLKLKNMPSVQKIKKVGKKKK